MSVPRGARPRDRPVSPDADVAITFDDGNASDIDHALPALRERGLHGTFFVVAGRLGTPRFLDEGDVRSRISRHGDRLPRHESPSVARTRRPRAARGAGRSEAILEDVVGRPVTRAACPFGSYDRRVLARCAGAATARLHERRGIARTSHFVQARNSVGADDASGLLERIAALESPGPRALLRA